MDVDAWAAERGPVSGITTKETQAWELCPGIPVTQISLLFYDTRSNEV